MGVKAIAVAEHLAIDYRVNLFYKEELSLAFAMWTVIDMYDFSPAQTDNNSLNNTDKRWLV